MRGGRVLAYGRVRLEVVVGERGDRDLVRRLVEHLVRVRVRVRMRVRVRVRVRVKVRVRVRVGVGIGARARGQRSVVRARVRRVAARLQQ